MVGGSIRRLLFHAKLLLAQVLSANAVGLVVGKLFRDQVPYRGIRVKTRDSCFSPRVKAQLFWGIYESAECRFICRYLQDANFAIELGSSLGATSAHLAQAMRTGGHLICVEANPALIPIITEAIDPIRKKKSLRVDVIHAAIVPDPRQEEVDFLLGGETLSSRAAHGSEDGNPTLVVPAVTLSELVHQSAFPEYVLVSDIEGGEASFILSDNRALRACRRMVIELHDVVANDIKSEELLDALIGLDFHVIDRRGVVVVLDQTSARLAP